MSPFSMSIFFYGLRNIYVPILYMIFWSLTKKISNKILLIKQNDLQIIIFLDFVSDKWQ